MEKNIDALIASAPQKSQKKFALAAMSLLFDMSNALPQIVAVVEEAEQRKQVEGPIYDTQCLDNALAALEEALS